MEYFVNNFQSFMMLMTRVTGLFFTAPVFSFDSIPPTVRIFLSFLTSLILFPVNAKFLPSVPASAGGFFAILLSEILIGVIIGFSVSIIFSAFQMAGEFFSVQIGFGYTEVLDPVSQSSLPVIGTMKNLMGILVYLVIGAHRMLIENLSYSFEKIRILTLTGEINTAMLKNFELAIGAMFIIAFKIALPVLGVLFLVTIAEALMGKAAPQINILQLSFQVKAAIGLGVLIMIIPFIEKQMVYGIELSFDRMHQIMKEWPLK